VAELMWWVGQGPELLRVGPSAMHFDNLQNVGPVPRLAGPLSDANRAGFVLLFYGMLLGRDVRGRLRGAALSVLVIVFALTISRSATLGAVTLFAVAAFRTRGRISLRAGAWATTIASAAVIAFLVAPKAIGGLLNVVTSPAVSRVSTNEGSAQGHLALIGRGLKEATQSVPRALIGIGYGTSNLVLQ